MEELRDSYPGMCLHGGEPLMIGKDDVRRILFRMKELYGKSSIQTNGVLIDNDFINIFKECSTNVGLSHDGPGELSKYRLYKFKNVNLDDKVRAMTKAGVSLSIITVVSKANAGTDQLLDKLKAWLLDLHKMNITGRLNPCGGAPGYELSQDRAKEVYLNLALFCLQHNLKWSPFTDIMHALQGKSRVCTFMGCDPFCTPSAAELLADGSVTNCMRLNKEGILLRAPARDYLRNDILSQTSQEFGGCQGCQYWSACQGGCPGMAINNDWRNRTYLCDVWKALFQFYDKSLAFCNIQDSSCNNIGGESPCPPELQSQLKEIAPGWTHVDSGNPASPALNLSASPSPCPPELQSQLKEIAPGWTHVDSGSPASPALNPSASPSPYPPELQSQLKEIAPGWLHADSDHIDHADHI